MPTHKELLCAAYERYHSENPAEDRYPPTLAASDGKLLGKMNLFLTSRYVTENTFIKRQPHPSELGNDVYGNPAVNPYVAERLRNEAAVLRYLRANSAAPVPELLDVWTENGLVYLKTAWVDGAVELKNMPAESMDAAVAAVSAQLEAEILPQLRRLRSRRMGCPDPELPIIPPQRYWRWKEKRRWRAVEGDYVLCHLDLDRQNIMIDPDTYKIVSIIDWEMAGFFPQEWELELWKYTDQESGDLVDRAVEADDGSKWLTPE